MFSLLLIALFSCGKALATNHALLKTTTQSSIYQTYGGALAVDGNTDGDWFRSFSCSSSDLDDLSPWWMVDLNRVVSVTDVRIYNRADGWGERLRNLEVRVYAENPIAMPTATGSLCTTYTGPASDGEVLDLVCSGPVSGRYVRVEKTKMEEQYDLLILCEVEVHGTVESRKLNLAQSRPTAESSGYQGYYSDLAVDGNPDAEWFRGHTCFSTAIEDSNPWWIVDLEHLYPVNEVVIYNRADGYGERLRNLEVRVYRDDIQGEGTLCSSYLGPASDGEVLSLTCSLPVVGRFVKISKTGKVDSLDLLTLCEVEVRSTETGCMAGFVNLDGECVFFSSTLATFPEALLYCDMLDSDLVMLKTESLDNAVTAHVTSNFPLGKFWVGASDTQEMTTFRWMDGEKVETPWKNTQVGNSPPDVMPVESGCGYIDASTGQWDAAPCQESMYYICQTNY